MYISILLLKVLYFTDFTSAPTPHLLHNTESFLFSDFPQKLQKSIYLSVILIITNPYVMFLHILTYSYLSI